MHVVAYSEGWYHDSREIFWGSLISGEALVKYWWLRKICDFVNTLEEAKISQISNHDPNK